MADTLLSLHEPVATAPEGGFASLVEDARPVFQFDNSVIMHRANKYDFALGEDSPGPQQLAEVIGTPAEDAIRQEYANREHLRNQFMRTQILDQYIQRIGGPQNIKQEDIEFIQNMPPEALPDPSTYFEKKFAERVTTAAGTMFEAARLDEAMKHNEELTFQAMDGATSLIAHMEFAKNLLEEAEARYQSMGLVTEKVPNFVETLVPAFSWWNMSSALEIPGAEGDFLLGNNLADQVQYYHLLPIEEAGPRLRQAFETMWEKNPYDAMQFLNGMLKFSASDQFINNVLSIADLTAFTPVKTFGRLSKAAGAEYRATGKNLMQALGEREAQRIFGTDPSKNPIVTFKNVLKDVAIAAAERKINPARVLDATGDMTAAAFQNSLNIVKQKIEKTGVLNSFNDIADEVFTIFDPKAVLKGPKYVMMSVEKQNRLVNFLMTSGQKILAELENPLHVSRIEPGSFAHQMMLEEAEQLFRNTWTDFNDAILNVRPINAADVIDNVDRLAIELGDKTGDLFYSAKAAEMFADMYGIPKREYRVKQHGQGYYIEVQRSLDETTPKVRQALTLDILKSGGTPHNLLDAWFGAIRGLRGAKNLLPKDVADAMDVATYGGSRMAALMVDLVKDLRKFKTDDLERFFEAQRRYQDPDTGELGRFSKSQGDFEMDFLSKFNRMPTEEESMAYWRYVQMNQLDLLVRNWGIYRDQSRIGMEMYGFPMEGIKTWKKPIFKGKQITHESFMKNVMPHASNNPFGILEWDIDPLKMATNHHYSGNLFQFRQMFDKYKDPEANWTFIQLTPEAKRIMRDQLPEKYSNVFKAIMDKYPLDYVAIRGGVEFERAPLDFWQLPNRPGGHIEYAYGHFIKQPEVKVIGADPERLGANPRSVYYGDKTLMWFGPQVEGNKIIKLIEEGRKIYAKQRLLPKHQRNYDELKEWLEKNLPIYDVKSFSRIFRDVKKGGAGMDPFTPFYLVRKGENVHSKVKLSDVRDENGNLRFPNFQVYAESPHNPYRDTVNMQYAMDRGDILQTITSENGVMKFEQAKLLDALPTIERSLGQLVRNRHLEDLKFKAAEGFVAEFHRVLKDDPVELSKAPIKALLDGNFRKDVTGDDRALLAAAKNYRRATLSFLNVQDENSKAWNYFKQKIGDLAFNVGGKKAFQLVEPWLIKDLASPVDKLRNIAFHSKFFGNIPAMIQQAQQIWVVAGIEGLGPSLRGYAATWLQHAALFDSSEQFLKHLADKATQFGWEKEWFIESFKALQRTGFHQVGNEVAERNVLLDGPIYRGKFGNFLHAGEIFFRAGELHSRYTAWNTAYLKWREANPQAKLTDKVVTEILSRASMTAGDMSKAGQAPWQQGWLGIPTQFMSYQLRLMELFWGKRITPQEKIGLLVSQGIMWGMPVGVGGTVFGLWPIHESWRETAINRGWDMNIDDNKFLEFWNDGLAATVLEFMTGGDFDTSRLGPGGISVVKEWADGNATIGEILGGVSTETAMKWLYTASPFLFWMMSIFSDEGYPVTPQDYHDFFTNVSGVSHTLRAYYAMDAGKYFTKNGQSLDMSASEGLMSAITGMLPERFADHYAIITNGTDRAKAQEEARREAVKNFRLAFKEKDPELMELYMKRARMAMPDTLFTPQERNRAFQQAAKDYGDPLNRTHFEFLKKRPDVMDKWLQRFEQKDAEQ